MYRFLFFGIIFLASCSSPNNKIKGRWIEKNNFKDPAIIEFNDFSMKISENSRITEQLYHFEKDTLFTSGLNGINKTSIKILNNELILSYNDTINNFFEIYKFNNILEYFNVKMNSSIELPKIKTNNNLDFKSINSILVDKINDSLRFYFNGDLHFINDTSFFNLIKPEENQYDDPMNLLFISKKLKVSVINEIKCELQKAQRFRIAFVVNMNDSLYCVKSLMPPFEGQLPLSVNGKMVPPQPPVPDWFSDDEPFSFNNILYYIGNDFSILNSDTIEFQILIKDFKEKIEKNPKVILHVYFDESMNYEVYLKNLYSFQQCYFDIRNMISRKMYNVPNFKDLDFNNQDEIRTNHPMRIREINLVEYKRLKNMPCNTLNSYTNATTSTKNNL